MPLCVCMCVCTYGGFCECVRPFTIMILFIVLYLVVAAFLLWISSTVKLLIPGTLNRVFAVCCRRLVLDLYEWFFASPDEHMSKYLTVRKRVIETCSAALHDKHAAQSQRNIHTTDPSGEGGTTAGMIGRQHQVTGVDDMEKSSTASLEQSSHYAKVLSMSANRTLPNDAPEQAILKFWEKLITFQRGRGTTESASWDLVREALLTQYELNLERLCCHDGERSRVLALIQKQLFVNRTEVSQADCIEFLHVNCGDIPHRPANDEWWTALQRSIAVHCCMEYI